MIRVKNLNGTADNGRPFGYLSWKNYWERKKGKPFGICSCTGCFERAEVGAHVLIDSTTDNRWYIVPLCIHHNVSNKNQVFTVNEADLVEANPK